MRAANQVRQNEVDAALTLRHIEIAALRRVVLGRIVRLRFFRRMLAALR